MSGQATGWVLRNGPRPTDTDANGKPYGLAGARSRRLVLAVLADAANRDGEHSHPGGTAIEEGALYSRSQAKVIAAALVADGWVVITDEGGGRGRAREYAIPGVKDPSWTYPGRAATDAPPDPFERGNGPISDSDTVRSGEVNGPGSEVNGPAQADPQRSINGTPNGSDQPPLADAPGSLLDLAFEEPPAPTPVDEAKRITDAAWEARTPRPTTPWIAARKMVEAFLAAGWPPAEIEAALAVAPTWTKGAIEFALNRARGQRGPRARVAEDRTAPEGRIEL